MIRTVNDLLFAIDLRQMQLGISDHELAKRINISRSTLCRWKYGVRTPNLLGLMMVINELELEINLTERSKDSEQVDILRA